MLPPAHVAALEQQLVGMAAVFETVATPLTLAAARSLRTIDVAALLTLPPERALLLLRDLIDSFQDFVDLLEVEPIG